VNCAQISSVKHFERSISVREVRSSAVLRYRTIYGYDLRATSVLTAVPYDRYRIAHVQLSTHVRLLHEADDDRHTEFLIFGEIGSSQAAETVRKKFFSRHDSTGKKTLFADLDSSCRAFQCYGNCAKISIVKQFERSTSVREVRSLAVLRYRTIYGYDLHATSVLTLYNLLRLIMGVSSNSLA